MNAGGLCRAAGAEMATLVFWPRGPIRTLCESRKDVVFLDDEGWWVYDGQTSSRRLIDVLSVPIQWGGLDLSGIVEKLRLGGPTWARWVSQADAYELLYRECEEYILHLIAGLRYFGIECAIFHTSVSHHVDSTLVEIACSHEAVPQVFLYSTGLDGRLLPIVQDQSIQDRRPLGVEVSRQSAGPAIASFIANKLEGGRPLHNQPVKSYYLSPVGAVAYCIYDRLRRRMRRPIGPRTGVLANLPEPSVMDQLGLIGRQKAALDYYDRHCVSLDVEELAEFQQRGRPALLIAAHFQPEAACFPEGGVFNNHLDIVLAFRNMGYNGPILYKEHFGSYRYFAPIIGLSRVGVFRSVAYFEAIQRLGCAFLPTSFPLTLQESTNRGYVPVTMTGTVALERSLGGFATVVAGHPWFAGIPGTVPISDTMDLLSRQGAATERSPATAEAAFAFLDAMLSGKTLTNSPGIGTGVPLTDQASLDTFRVEFEALLSQLPDRERRGRAKAPWNTGYSPDAAAS